MPGEVPPFLPQVRQTTYLAFRSKTSSFYARRELEDSHLNPPSYWGDGALTLISICSPSLCPTQMPMGAEGELCLVVTQSLQSATWGQVGEEATASLTTFRVPCIPPHFLGDGSPSDLSPPPGTAG